MEMTPELTQALQQQMNKERMNSQHYSAFAAALEADNWPGFAAWMERAAAEELEHYKKFRDHLIDRNQTPVISSLDAPMLIDGSQPLAFFQAALNIERENTASIIALDELADEQGDEQTDDWIIWAVLEQTKSERELVDAILELSRMDPTGLLMLDREYGK